ncbi:MAG: molecular chaperone TorD family protein [Limisphaerales bacterium]
MATELKNLAAGCPTQPAVRKSVFGNYRAAESAGAPVHEASPPVVAPEVGGPGEAKLIQPVTTTLQSSLDHTIARCFLHRMLARAYEGTERTNWDAMQHADFRTAFSDAVHALNWEPLSISAPRLLAALVRDDYETFASDYALCFGHTVRGDCPLNEIEYRDLNADPLFQPHRLSDLGAFYAAFGLELAADAGERIDHISIQLEFLSVLAAHEAYALEHQFDADQIEVIRDAQRKFLREHLGRWAPAFALRLGRMAGDSALGALARFTGDFIRMECLHCGVPPGNDDLALRPVDDAAERLCDSCGLAGTLPGATQPALTEPV